MKHKDDGPRVMPILIILRPKLAAAIDGWIGERGEKISRDKAIKRILKEALGVPRKKSKS